jgi:hypothetical protein|tara:strand:+ start:2137 stop:2610 length:474 start_codon:yes stop_codon:yes gene_type:complete
MEKLENYDTLGKILKDKAYLPHDSSSYRGFIADMKTAVDTGRYITPKMFTAINKIIKTYHDWKDPSKLVQNRTNQERIFRKLNQLRGRLERASYSAQYEIRTNLFIDSVEKQATRKFSISDGQMKALNKMYKKFNQRIEKVRDELDKKGFKKDEIKN